MASRYRLVICYGFLLFTYFLWFDFTGDEVKVVCTPPFADSISEGDMKLIKGKCPIFATVMLIMFKFKF